MCEEAIYRSINRWIGRFSAQSGSFSQQRHRRGIQNVSIIGVRMRRDCQELCSIVRQDCCRAAFGVRAAFPTSNTAMLKPIMTTIYGVDRCAKCDFEASFKMLFSPVTTAPRVVFTDVLLRLPLLLLLLMLMRRKFVWNGCFQFPTMLSRVVMDRHNWVRRE